MGAYLLEEDMVNILDELAWGLSNIDSKAEAKLEVRVYVVFPTKMHTC
jgi:hypothetical protein